MKDLRRGDRFACARPFPARAAASDPACAHTPPCAGPHRAGAAARCATTAVARGRRAAALRCARRCTARCCLGSVSTSRRKSRNEERACAICCGPGAPSSTSSGSSSDRPRAATARAQAVDGDVAGHAEQVGAGVDDAAAPLRLRRRPIRQAQPGVVQAVGSQVRSPGGRAGGRSAARNWRPGNRSDRPGHRRTRVGGGRA